MYKFFRIISSAALIVVSMLLGGCSTPKDIVYFQDVESGMQTKMPEMQIIKIKPKDKISIIVSSKDPELATLFNLPVVSFRAGQESGQTALSQEIAYYTVDSEGNIDFPVLGKIYVEGISREEISALIKNKLIGGNHIKDPVVTTEFVNLNISVLGEVARPGRYKIDRDRLTILDALSMAGDLTINGRRDGVIIMREDEGVQYSYKVNVQSAKELYASPVFYLQQNDIIYVEPNDVKIRQSTVNGNNLRSSSFWISLASLLTNVMVLVTSFI